MLHIFKYTVWYEVKADAYNHTRKGFCKRHYFALPFLNILSFINLHYRRYGNLGREFLFQQTSHKTADVTPDLSLYPICRGASPLVQFSLLSTAAVYMRFTVGDAESFPSSTSISAAHQCFTLICHCHWGVKQA